MRVRTFISAFLFVTASQTAGAVDLQAPPGWTEASRNKDIVIFYQENDRAHVRAFKAVGDADATPEAVFRVVTDVESHPKFMPFTKESRIVKRINESEIIAYQVIAPPMISARDSDLHIHVFPGTGANSIWRSEWFSVPDFEPAHKDLVRMPIVEGSWQFEPLDGGRRTRITYTSLTNIGGSVPGWITNMSNLSVIPNIFDAVRKRILEVLKNPPPVASIPK